MNAGMAQALELLRSEVLPALITDFLGWVNKQVMPQVRDKRGADNTFCCPALSEVLLASYVLCAVVLMLLV